MASPFYWPVLVPCALRAPAQLTAGVSLRKIRNIEAHVLFTGVYLLKRLFVGFWVSRRASPWGAAPVFSFFASSAPPPWHTAFSRFAPVVNLGLPVLGSVSNRAVKPTSLRQAAYFRSLELPPQCSRSRLQCCSGWWQRRCRCLRALSISGLHLLQSPSSNALLFHCMV